MTNLSLKAPRPVFEGDDTVFAFPPNRDTMGGTAYLILDHSSDPPSNILVDSPAWDGDYQQFLRDRGGVRWLVITHRGGIGAAKAIQADLGCKVIIQEQEAYLLPEVEVTAFQQEMTLSDRAQVLWTAGHSPGSSCLYYNHQGGILFTGRHLLPDRQGHPAPLRTSKTFHWPRQLRSIERLSDRFSAETLAYICPGANTGFLRGKRAIAHAYKHLSSIDLIEAAQSIPLL